MSPGMERRSLSRALSAALEYRERFRSSRWSWIASAIPADLPSGLVVLSVLVYTVGSKTEPPRSADRGGAVVPSVGAVRVDARFQRLATASGRRPRSSSHRKRLQHGHERGTTSNRQNRNSVHVKNAEQVRAQCCECALCRRSDSTLSRGLPKLASPNAHSSRSFLSMGRRSCK